MELEFPSEQFPGPPTVRMTVPDSWEPVPHATTTLAAVDRDSPDDFRVNVLVTVARVLTDQPLDDLVDTVSRMARQGMTTTLEGTNRTSIDGHEAILSAFTIEDRRVPFPLFQAEGAVAVPRARVSRDLVQLTATCPKVQADHYGVVFRQIWDTLELT